MYLALDPGTKQAGELPEGGTSGVEHAARRQPRRGPRATSTPTRAPTSRSCSAPAGRPSTITQPAPTSASSRPRQDLRETFKRFEPTARYGDELTSLADRAAPQHHARDPQLPAALDGAGAPDGQLARLRGLRRTRTSRRSRPRTRRCAETLQLLPGTLSTAEHHAQQGRQARPGSSGRRSRRCGRSPASSAPALRKATRPFLKQTTPIIQNQLRPFARDVQPTVQRAARAPPSTWRRPRRA